MLFRYRISKTDRACIILKFKLYCSKKGCGQFQAIDISIPIEEIAKIQAA